MINLISKATNMVFSIYAAAHMILLISALQYKCTLTKFRRKSTFINKNSDTNTFQYANYKYKRCSQL